MEDEPRDSPRRDAVASRANTDTVDVTAYCPSCGRRGVYQKCKLICENPECSVRIILACID